METKKKYIATIQEILAGRNYDFDMSKVVKIIRHADTRKPKERGIYIGNEPTEENLFKGTLLELYRYDIDTFNEYQRAQRKGLFEKTDYLVVTMGESGTKARFIAVYKIRGYEQNPYVEGEILLALEEVEEFKPLSGRILIDWGKSTVSWYQDFRKQIKPVVRIDEGFENENGVPRFISYADTILSFDEMKAIFSHEDDEWKNKLQAVNGIYLIQDMLNGKQYVGSTYGNKGIWGRWQAYFLTEGHGGNKGLEEKIAEQHDYAKHFQWVILETLSLQMTEKEVIDCENLYKRKFLTREFGYNKN